QAAADVATDPRCDRQKSAMKTHKRYWHRWRERRAHTIGRLGEYAADCVPFTGTGERCPPIGVTTTSSERGTMQAIQRHAAAQLPVTQENRTDDRGRKM